MTHANRLPPSAPDAVLEATVRAAASLISRVTLSGDDVDGPATLAAGTVAEVAAAADARLAVGDGWTPFPTALGASA